MSKPQIGQYKGNPTITLNPGAQWPFTFGADKAALIVEHFEEIRKFSAAYPPKQKTARAAGELVITLEDGHYFAEEMAEPRRAQVIRLMGSAKIVTPYLATTPAAEVVAALQKRNPGAIVRLAA